MKLAPATDLLGPAPTLAPCVATSVARHAATAPGNDCATPEAPANCQRASDEEAHAFCARGHVGHNGNGSGSGNATARMRASVCKVVWLRWRIVSAGAH